MVRNQDDCNDGAGPGKDECSTRIHRFALARSCASTNNNEDPDDLLHDVAVHIGQPHVAAAETEGQSLVIDAQQVQHRGVQVVNLDTVFDDLIAPFVRRTVECRP